MFYSSQERRVNRAKKILHIRASTPSSVYAFSHCVLVHFSAVGSAWNPSPWSDLVATELLVSWGWACPEPDYDDNGLPGLCCAQRREIIPIPDRKSSYLYGGAFSIGIPGKSTRARWAGCPQRKPAVGSRGVECTWAGVGAIGWLAGGRVGLPARDWSATKDSGGEAMIWFDEELKICAEQSTLTTRF